MVSTTAVTEAVTGVLHLPRRSMGTLTHLVARPGSRLVSAESSPVLDAARRDPALTAGQRLALVERYESFRVGPPVHVPHEIDHAAAGRAHVC